MDGNDRGCGVNTLHARLYTNSRNADPTPTLRGDIRITEHGHGRTNFFPPSLFLSVSLSLSPSLSPPPPPSPRVHKRCLSSFSDPFPLPPPLWAQRGMPQNQHSRPYSKPEALMRKMALGTKRHDLEPAARLCHSAVDGVTDLEAVPAARGSARYSPVPAACRW